MPTVNTKEHFYGIRICLSHPTASAPRARCVGWNDFNLKIPFRRCFVVVHFDFFLYHQHISLSNVIMASIFSCFCNTFGSICERSLEEILNLWNLWWFFFTFSFQAVMLSLSLLSSSSTSSQLIHYPLTYIPFSFVSIPTQLELNLSHPLPPISFIQGVRTNLNFSLKHSLQSLHP